MPTLVKRGLSNEARLSGISPLQAKKVHKALDYIRSTSSEELLRSRNLRKIKVAGRDDVYVYRVDMNQRIVLSINEKEKIIQRILDTRTMRK